MAGTITRACVAILLLNIQISKTSHVQAVTETKACSDGLLVHLVNSIVKYETKVLEHQLENKLQRQQEKHDEDLKKVADRIKYVEQKHAEDIKILKASLATKQPITPVVGFHVALDHDQPSVGKVAFNRVLSNYGKGWNSITHTYRVPTKGLYFLILSVMNDGSTHAYAWLMRGSIRLQFAYAAGGHDYNMGTQSTVLLLDAGEHIYAQHTGGRLHSNEHLDTHLAGFLIQAAN